MSNFRKLTKEDSGEFAQILFHAFPVPGGDRESCHQWLLDEMETNPEANFYGVFRDERLLGGMRLNYFKMKLLSAKVNAGGVGMVCTHFLHKKEKAAKDLLAYFLINCKDRGANLAMLYAFNLDFYRRMGFGYGAKIHQFRIRPESFPQGNSKRNLVYLAEKDKEAVIACYQRYLERTSGMIEKKPAELNRMFNRKDTLVGYRENGKLQGYIIFDQKRASDGLSNLYDLEVKEWVCETREALAEICTFLNSQSGQINRVIVNTHDDQLFYLLSDPANGSVDSFQTPPYHESYVTALGVMYRIIDVRGIFKELAEHDFNRQDCKLKLNIKDNFFKINEGSTVIHFVKGKAVVQEGGGDYEVEVSMEIADFSSLLTGAVSFKKLYQYRLADISEPGYIDIVDKIFWTDQKPVCTTLF
jgi:predicted acetyltransferase